MIVFLSPVVLYLLVGLLSVVLPSPTDPLHFYLQNWLYRHRVSRLSFELWQLVDWYLLDGLWFVFLIGVVFLFGIHNLDQVRGIGLVATFVGLGVCFSVGWRFLRRKR